MCVCVCVCMCDVSLSVCMCVRTCACTDGEPGAKKRRVMCLLEKMEVLDKLQSGMSIATVRCHYGVNKLEMG